MMRSRIGRADPEVNDRQSFIVGAGLHWSALSLNRTAEAFRKFPEVNVEIGKQDVVTEIPNLRSSVSRQPVPGDFVLRMHQFVSW